MARRRALVVGAGIMGLCTAWALRRDGWDVQVLDRAPVPNPLGSSVDQHRLIRHAYGAQAGYMRMVDQAYAAWDRLWADLNEDLHIRTGVLALSAGPGWLDATRASLAADGRAFEDLDPGRIAEAYPFIDPAGLTAALRLESGGVLLAERIVTGLARLLGDAVQRAEVTEIDPARAAVRVGAAWQAADLLVVAAGPWTNRLVPALAARMTPSRQVLIYVQPPDDLAEAWTRAPMLLDLSTGFYAVPPVAGTRLKIGDHTFSLDGDPDAPRSVAPAEVDAMLARCARRLRGLDRYRVTDAKVCFYDVEAAEEFIVEPLGPACWVLSGFSGHGFKFGAVLGEAVARAAGDAGWAARVADWAAGREADDVFLAD
jgi:sarcosine oxidase subunit beta